MRTGPAVQSAVGSAMGDEDSSVRVAVRGRHAAAAAAAAWAARLFVVAAAAAAAAAACSCRRCIVCLRYGRRKGLRGRREVYGR